MCASTSWWGGGPRDFTSRALGRVITSIAIAIAMNDFAAATWVRASHRYLADSSHDLHANIKTKNNTHINEARRAQKEMILLHLLAMNNTKVPPYIAITTPQRVSIGVSAFKRLVFLVREVCHGSFEFGDDGSWGEVPGREDA